MMIKNEWIKLFRNRVFLACFAAVFLFYGFYLYWMSVLYRPSFAILTKAPPSYYNALVEELSAFSDEDKLEILTERCAQMTEMVFDGAGGSAIFLHTEIAHEELLDEIDRVVHYQDILSTVIRNTQNQERRLDRGNYGAMERRYLESRLAKTEEVYQRLSDIKPIFSPSRGLQALINNPVTDLCFLFLILLATFQILTVERHNEQIILSKSTVRGRSVHGTVKALTLGLLCILVTVLLTAEGLLVTGCIFPPTPFANPVQSVYPYCALRINIGEYVCLYTMLKILFYFFCMAMIYFVCCLFRRVITIFLVIFAGGGLMVSVYLGISENSYLAPVRMVSPIGLGQAGELLERYQCVNVLGFAVNKVLFTVVLLCVGTLLFLAAAVKVYAVSGEKHILTDRRSVYDKKKRWGVSLTAHECYKAFISQKLLLLLAAVAVFSYFYRKDTNTYSMDSDLVDHYYYVASYFVEGEYTEEILEDIRRLKADIAEKLSRPDAWEREGERMVYEAMAEAYSQMESYAEYLSTRENSYYINNPAYIELTGGNQGANRANIITSMLMYAFAVVCFVLTMSIDYQRGENRLIHSTVKGRWHYGKAKVLIGMVISLILLILFWIPSFGTFGTDYIFAPAYSLQHLSWVWGGISIFTYLCLGYVARYLSLLAVMAVSYLMEIKVKSSIVAIICVCAVVEIPLAIMLMV